MYYKKEIETILEELRTSFNGLSKSDADIRLKEFGFNELKEKQKTPVWKLFLETFKDPLVIILLIASALQLFLGEVVDSIIILIVLILNGILGVVQTKKAEGSLEALKGLSAPNAKVIRDKQKISTPAKELVPGDIISLEAGDCIPADGRIIESQSLKVMEGMLTGESEAVTKESMTLDTNVALGDQKNMIFSGALVVYGRGTAVVTGTGMNTEIGKIAGLLENTVSEQTPLQKKLDIFSKWLGVGIAILSGLILLILILREGKFTISAFMFAVAVAIAAIPEALSSIVTIVLAVGTNIMAKKNAIIRKLPAVETLGSTGIICTDKTGTLTQNKMTAVDYSLGSFKGNGFNADLDKLSLQEKYFIFSSVLSNDSSITAEGKEIGDPTEVALINYANKCKYDFNEIRKNCKRVWELPFDSDRKLMSTLNDLDGKIVMFSKGAPDVVFSRCSKILVGDEIVDATPELINNYRTVNEDFSKEALRVLAFAYKDVEKNSLDLDDERDYTLVGLVAMIDPPREEVKDAIVEAKKAGIKPIMITGDHKTTAAAIARNIGIMEPGDLAFTGQEIDCFTDDELMEKLEKITVYARVSPENKIRIVRAWQLKGKITAMTGDGVNDAPALKQADIGIAMGTGTDVAKDASAMILTDDNFASIVHAIEVGRSVYSNIKKSVGYLFAGNLGAIIAIIFALLIGWESPFTALQLLFINLVNDSLPAIALGLEKPEPNIMLKAPRNPKEPLFAGNNLMGIIFRGSMIGIAVIIAQYIGGVPMAFTTVIFARILQTLPARSSDLSTFKIGIFSNKYVTMAMITCFMIYSVTLIPILRPIFKIPTSFGIKEIGICLGLAFVSMILMELEKVIGGNKNEI